MRVLSSPGEMDSTKSKAAPWASLGLCKLVPQVNWEVGKVYINRGGEKTRSRLTRLTSWFSSQAAQLQLQDSGVC